MLGNACYAVLKVLGRTLLALPLLAACTANDDPQSISDGTLTTGGSYSGSGRLYVALDTADTRGGVVGVDVQTLSALQQTLAMGMSGQITVNNGELFQAGMLNGTGTVRVISAVLLRPATTSFDPSRDIEATVASFVQPGAIALGRFGYWPVVADLQASASGPAIHLLTRYLAGSVAHQRPSERAIVSSAVAGGAISAVAYDNFHDRLFAARRSGVIVVFDGFVSKAASSNQSPTVTRTITPGSGGHRQSVLLGGLAYDRRSDTLFVSELGDLANAHDGAIYVYANASTASDADSGGVVTPTHTLSGAASGLGNPVSLAYDPLAGGLAVADTANPHISIFADAVNGTSSTPAVTAIPAMFGYTGTPISVSFTSD